MTEERDGGTALPPKEAKILSCVEQKGVPKIVIGVFSAESGLLSCGRGQSNVYKLGDHVTYVKGINKIQSYSDRLPAKFSP
jgi:hypothetical protein